MNPDLGSADLSHRQTMHVHVVDDDAGVLASVAAMLRHTEWHCSTYTSVAAFRQALDPTEQCCVIMDLRMPEQNGIEAMMSLHEEHPEIPVVVVSGEADIPLALTAIRSGAMDFLEKPFGHAVLHEVVGRGLSLCRQQQARRQRRDTLVERIQRLTPREIEVMGQLRHGKSAKEIAEMFGVSHKTVQIHRSRVLKGLMVDSAVELANLFHELNLNDAGQPNGESAVIIPRAEPTTAPAPEAAIPR